MTRQPPPLSVDARSLVGAEVRRREDGRLLRGRAIFCDDVQLPEMVYAAFIRSPHAHARITALDTSGALAHPAVLCALTLEDLDKAGVGPIKPNWVVSECHVPRRPVLADGTVRFVGEPVAVVVASSREAAVDAAELVQVEYDPLPAVSDAEAALAADSVPIHENVPGNLIGRWDIGGGDVEAAFARAHSHVKLRLENNRLIPSALEPRAIVAQYEADTQQFTMHVSSQMPHMCRRWVAETLHVPESRLRVIAPEVGGGFGSKMHLYPEEIVVPFCARLLQRPVKWTETRSENHVATTHGRAHTEYIEAAVEKDGRILGMKLRTVANMGAYLSNMATGIPTVNCATFGTGCYRIENYQATVDLVTTNTVPVDAYRGAGRPEAAYIIERTVDAVANHLSLDPCKVRELNMIEKGEFPYQPYGNPIFTFDSGDYQQSFNKAKELIGYDQTRQRQREMRAGGRYIGVAVTNYNEICGVGRSHELAMVGFDRGGWESAAIRVHSDGTVTFLTGSMPSGQGHATSYAQIVAAELQLPLESVDVVYGDTAMVPMGNGTYNSRSMPVGGSAAKRCAMLVLEKARALAAKWLGDDASTLRYESGKFHGESGEVEFAQVARLAHLAHMLPEGQTPGLDVDFKYEPEAMSSPHGSHAAIVEVDVETGTVKLLKYVAVDDVGTLVNPLLATGQVHGGVVQGVGQALFELADYGDDAQLLSGSLLDYALPKFDQVCSIESHFFETPSPTNPLGAKGVGEAGACAAPPLMVAAVCDALSPFGISHLDMPLTAPRIWRAIQKSRETENS